MEIEGLKRIRFLRVVNVFQISLSELEVVIGACSEMNGYESGRSDCPFGFIQDGR
jgi:hypothetical protein